MSHLSPFPVAPPSRPLVARVASVAISCCAAFFAPAGCCVPPFALLSCAALLSSRRTAGCCLSRRLSLSPYCLAPPSRALVTPADCWMSSCRPILLCGPLVLSSSCCAGWLLLVASPLLPYRLALPSLALGALSYCAALSINTFQHWNSKKN